MPKAVYLDFLYRHNHGDDADISQLVKTMSSRVVDSKMTSPVLIPQLIKDTPTVESCKPNTQNPYPTAASIVQTDSIFTKKQRAKRGYSYVGWTGCGNRYPAYILGDHKYMTPAFHLYNDFCKDASSEDGVNCSDIQAGNYGKFEKPMMIMWGTGVSKEQEEFYNHFTPHCPTINKESFFSKLRYSIKQFIIAFGQRSLRKQKSFAKIAGESNCSGWDASYWGE